MQGHRWAERPAQKKMAAVQRRSWRISGMREVKLVNEKRGYLFGNHKNVGGIFLTTTGTKVTRRTQGVAYTLLRLMFVLK